MNSTRKKVLAISGSTRLHSANEQILKAIQVLYVDTLDVQLYNGISALPHFNPDIDDENVAETVKAFRELINRADGVIAFHISNRYLDLTGVTRQLADELGMQAVRVVDDPGDDSDLYRSDWVLLTANTALVERLTADRIGSIVPVKPGLKPWTDDYNNLFAVLK